jgi:hypothetical protein
MFADNRRLTIQPYFKWFDLWIGAYFDTTLDILYVQPIPCFGLKVYLAGEKHIERRRSTDSQEVKN